MAGDEEQGANGPEYEAMLQVEDLESLLEEIEEAGDYADSEHTSLRERLSAAGLSSVDELRRRIAEMHRQLDSEG